MILINLLPEEHRTRRRTPIRLLAAVSALVALNASLIAWWAWLAVGVTTTIESKRDVLQDGMDSLTPQIAYHKELEKENRQYKSREATLESITQNRVSWTLKLDELVDVINLGGGGKKYLIWLDDVLVTQTVDKRRNSFGGLKAQGHSGSANFAQVANFLEDVAGHPFSTDFLPPAYPEGSQSPKDPTLVPSEFWNFNLEVALRAPEERAKARQGAPK